MPPGADGPGARCRGAGRPHLSTLRWYRGVKSAIGPQRTSPRATTAQSRASLSTRKSRGGPHVAGDVDKVAGNGRRPRAPGAAWSPRGPDAARGSGRTGEVTGHAAAPDWASRPVRGGGGQVARRAVV